MKKLLLVICSVLWLCSTGLAAEQSVYVQVRYREMVDINGQKLEFSDALYYPADEYSQITQDDIDKVKEERISAWKELVTNTTAK